MPGTLHIVHTEASCGWGGQEIRILTEAQGMQRRGHRVSLLANPDAPILRAGAGMGLDTHALPLQKKRLRGLGAMRGWLGRHQPDLVNTHSSIDAWLVALARIGRPLPIVRTRHISAPVPRNPFSRWLYRHGADRVVTTGERLCQDLRQQLGGDPTHFLSIPTGIDLDRYSRGAAWERAHARRELGLPDDALVIGIAATLRTWKGHDYLVAAFEQLAADTQNLHLLVVGDGPMGPHLQALTDASTHASRIHMAGHRSDVENALAAMDIFALPSYANEGVPQAILQAMAMQLPVVSTGVGAIGEALIDGETGIRVEPRDADSLAAGIRRLIDNPVLRVRMGDAGRTLVERHFSLDRMLDGMEQVFREVT